MFMLPNEIIHDFAWTAQIGYRIPMFISLHAFSFGRKQKSNKVSEADVYFRFPTQGFACFMGIVVYFRYQMIKSMIMRVCSVIELFSEPRHKTSEWMSYKHEFKVIWAYSGETSKSRLMPYLKHEKEHLLGMINTFYHEK